MTYKRHIMLLASFISLIVVFFIIYKFLFYTPLLLDHGKRNIIENTIDFFICGWYLTKASIYSDYIKNKDKATKEQGNAGWYRKKYIEKKFEVDGDDLISILEVYKNLNTTSILKDLYIFFMKEDNHEIIFLREAGEKFSAWSKWKNAAEAYSKVIDSNPDDIMSYYYLGLSYLNLKRLIKANQCFERVIELKPNFADAYYQLGLISEKEKSWKKAQNLYKKAINILPNHLDSLKALKRIYKKLQ